MTPRIITKVPITWTSDQSQPIWVGDFRNVCITIVGTGNASVLGTKDPELVDFTVASTIGNAYATMVLADETVTSSSYVTVLTVAGATKVAEVNSNVLGWISVTRSAGTLDAFITYTDNA